MRETLFPLPPIPSPTASLSPSFPFPFLLSAPFGPFSFRSFFSSLGIWGKEFPAPFPLINGGPMVHGT